MISWEEELRLETASKSEAAFLWALSRSSKTLRKDRYSSLPQTKGRSSALMFPKNLGSTAYSLFKKMRGIFPFLGRRRNMQGAMEPSTEKKMLWCGSASQTGISSAFKG